MRIRIMRIRFPKRAIIATLLQFVAANRIDRSDPFQHDQRGNMGGRAMDDVKRRLAPLVDAGIVKDVSSYAGGYGSDVKGTIVVYVDADPVQHEPKIRELLTGIDAPISVRVKRS